MGRERIGDVKNGLAIDEEAVVTIDTGATPVMLGEATITEIKALMAELGLPISKHVLMLTSSQIPFMV